MFRDWKPKGFDGALFVLVDPGADKIRSAVILYGPNGESPPTMPKHLTLPGNAPVNAYTS